MKNFLNCRNSQRKTAPAGIVEDHAVFIHFHLFKRIYPGKTLVQPDESSAIKVNDQSNYCTLKNIKRLWRLGGIPI